MSIQKEKAGLQGKYVAGINTRKSTNTQWNKNTSESHYLK